jgi:hypothetical protein
LLDQHRQVGPHRGLAAGEADAVDAEALDQHPGDALDLLEGEQLVAGQPLHPLLGHAVGAAEVAAVGDRDAQVAVDPPERVEPRSSGRTGERWPAILRRAGAANSS